MESHHEDNEKDQPLMFSISSNLKILEQKHNQTNKKSSDQIEYNYPYANEKNQYCSVTYFNIQEKEFKQLNGYFSK